jgi:transposase InsO family protein
LTGQNSSPTVRKLLQIFLKQITFALDINWRQRTIHAPLQLDCPKPTMLVCEAQGSSNGEVFYSLKEAQVLTERWRVEYNTQRPHSALGYSLSAEGLRRRSQKHG